ncbi:MAG: ABC transporter ATP-binding protein [Clostridiales bacterium]|nr:ABC transporter ATP-binding protein [Clostridiales bacterium]
MSRLELRGITVAYDNFTLSDVSFSCSGGEILALIGRNGAGKTTTLDSIMGLTKRQSGSVYFDGQPVTKANEHQFKQKIGYVSAAQDYYPNIRVSTFLNAASGFYARWDKAKTARYLSSFGIDQSKKLSQLSTGMRVKLSLVIALSHSAEIFLLDEPTSGLDPIVREQVLEILERLARENDACILFSSHITQDVEKIASRILFLVDGAIKMDTLTKSFGGSFVKLHLNDSLLRSDPIRQKGVFLGDRFVILKASDAANMDLSPYERAPLLIEDALIFLNGGVHNVPVD